MANDQGGIYFFNLRKLIKNNNFTIIKFGVKSVILFIYNPNYFKILVSCLIRLFDFESLHDFHISLEILLDFFHILSRALSHLHLLVVYIKSSDSQFLKFFRIWLIWKI